MRKLADVSSRGGAVRIRVELRLRALPRLAGGHQLPRIRPCPLGSARECQVRSRPCLGRETLLQSREMQSRTDRVESPWNERRASASPDGPASRHCAVAACADQLAESAAGAAACVSATLRTPRASAAISWATGGRAAAARRCGPPRCQLSTVLPLGRQSGAREPVEARGGRGDRAAHLKARSLALPPPVQGSQSREVCLPQRPHRGLLRLFPRPFIQHPPSACKQPPRMQPRRGYCIGSPEAEQHCGRASP